MNTKFLKELSEIIAGIEDPTIAKDFLTNILTPGELEEVCRRLQIVKLLMAGIPQRKIAKKLGVSIGTVSRGAREIKYGAPGFKKVII